MTNLQDSCAGGASSSSDADSFALTEKFSTLRTLMWCGSAESFLSRLPRKPIFDLVVTSPPYNIGKEYETPEAMDSYLKWQCAVIDEIVPRLADTGSICWQVGNFVSRGEILPLDIEFAPLFRKHGLKLRNRIVWHFGHGLHSKKRFSGRYEVVLWYTRSDSYTFNLDAVRVPAKYPGKRHFKGPRTGELSGNPLGKNPEDIWDFDDVWSIPNVKSNHPEKTIHPCQFPVGLIERLILALTKPDGLVFDPYAGVASAGVAAAANGRRFWGCEVVPSYAEVGRARIDEALAGKASYRRHNQPLYDHTQSSLSQIPEEWKVK